MPLAWKISPVLAGRTRRSVALLLIMVLLWLEPQAEKRSAIVFFFNKPAAYDGLAGGVLGRQSFVSVVGG